MKKARHTPFYGIAYRLMLLYETKAVQRKRAEKTGSSCYEQTAGRYIEILHPGQRVIEKQREYYADKLALALIVLICGGIFAAVLAALASSEQHLVKGQYLEREQYGGGTKEEMLSAGIDGWQEAVEVEVRERKYLPKEAEMEMEKAKKEIPARILGKNESLDEVREPLQLIRALPGYPFSIEWKSDRYEIMDSSGKLREEKIKEEGELVKLTALLRYEEYESSLEFYIRVLPRQLTQEERLREALYESLKENEEASRTEKYMLLPSQIEGKTVVWKEKKDRIAIQVFFLALLASVLVFFAKDTELRKEIQKRERQMLMDYPDIVSKLALLLGAGMTLKAAWEKICSDYQKSRKKAEKRYAYEEMLITCYEMQSGVSLASAFEHFGKRCKAAAYLKLGSLLSQNIRIGAKGMLQMLQAEASLAFEERKNTAKKLGEEAGTRLLIPMFLMLGIVMLLLVFPACLSFQIS